MGEAPASPMIPVYMSTASQNGSVMKLPRAMSKLNPLTLGNNSGSSGGKEVSQPSLRDMLSNHARFLSETQMRIEALLKTSKDPQMSRAQTSDLSTLGGTLFRLQHATSEVLEFMMLHDAQSNRPSQESSGQSSGHVSPPSSFPRA